MGTIDSARCVQAMVPMRDGVRLNTFVFLPETGGPRFPAILHRTPYGITLPAGEHVTDCTKGWLPDPKTPLFGPILRGWREIVRHGYAAVYQDCRGRYGSEGEVAFTVTTLPMDTTRLNGSRANPGPIIGLDSQAPQRQQRRRSLRRRSAIQQRARSSLKSAAPASTMTWSTRVNR